MHCLLIHLTHQLEESWLEVSGGKSPTQAHHRNLLFLSWCSSHVSTAQLWAQCLLEDHWHSLLKVIRSQYPQPKAVHFHSGQCHLWLVEMVWLALFSGNDASDKFPTLITISSVLLIIPIFVLIWSAHNAFGNSCQYLLSPHFEKHDLCNLQKYCWHYWKLPLVVEIYGWGYVNICY